MNYGTKLKQLLLKLALSSLSHEPLKALGTVAMEGLMHIRALEGLMLKMLVMLNLQCTIERMFTTHLLITV